MFYEFPFQLLLLNDLYDTRMCHALLVPEADEEVSWKLDRVPKPKQEHSANSSSEYIIDGYVKYIRISHVYCDKFSCCCSCIIVLRPWLTSQVMSGWSVNLTGLDLLSG